MKYPIEDRIISVTDADVTWNWDTSEPSYSKTLPGARYSHVHRTFDPFPCYPHNRDLVIKEAQRVEKCFPVGFNTFYFLFPFEPTSRTNGCAYKSCIGQDKNDRDLFHYIVELNGKRIVISPHMTAYLVSHEYGHCVDNWICYCKRQGDNGIDAEYARMRDIEKNQRYGGRQWHTNIGEIIANDFRICVTKTQPEFWPHYHIKHPDEDDNVKNWWYEAMLKYSSCTYEDASRNQKANQ